MAGGGELPEQPGAVPIGLMRLGGDGAEPEIVAGQLALQHLAVEGDVGIDDRPLAGMRFHHLEHDGDLLERAPGGDFLRAGARVPVPFEVEHRGQRVGVVRDVEDEPERLLVRRPAPIDHVIGAARDAGALGAFPVLLEFRVEIVAAFGCLDEGEPGAGGAHPCPIDVALPVGDVDALDWQLVRARDALMRRTVGKPGGGDGPAETAGYCQNRDQNGQAAIRKHHRTRPPRPRKTRPNPKRGKIVGWGLTIRGCDRARSATSGGFRRYPDRRTGRTPHRRAPAPRPALRRSRQERPPPPARRSVCRLQPGRRLRLRRHGPCRS